MFVCFIFELLSWALNVLKYKSKSFKMTTLSHYKWVISAMWLNVHRLSCYLKYINLVEITVKTINMNVVALSSMSEQNIAFTKNDCHCA